MLIWLGSEILTESEITQPLSLVITTEYNPEERLSILFVVFPLDHKKVAKARGEWWIIPRRIHTDVRRCSWGKPNTWNHEEDG